jgi:hypothetical protein
MTNLILTISGTENQIAEGTPKSIKRHLPSLKLIPPVKATT